MEDNRIVDTPQQINPNETNSAFDAPAVPESSTNTNLTVEDAFMGITEPESQETPPSQEPAPSIQETTPTEAEYQAKNDEKRFEYWQSQAAQRENELKQLQGQLQQQQTAPQQAQEQVPQKQQVEEFPPPPGRPQKPRGFSREDAWGDSASESARYLDEVDQWQDDINSYNELKHQYDMAVMQEKFEGIEKDKAKAVQHREAQVQQQRQVQEISQYVQGHHGFSETDTQDFIQTMSKPDSVSMDNLVALYRMQKGMPGQNVPQGTGQPSDTFTQTQNAQQIPSPMGVVTGNTGASTRSDSDQIMDSLIGDFNSNNPWK